MRYRTRVTLVLLTLVLVPLGLLASPLTSKAGVIPAIILLALSAALLVTHLKAAPSVERRNPLTIALILMIVGSALHTLNGSLRLDRGQRITLSVVAGALFVAAAFFLVRAVRAQPVIEGSDSREPSRAEPTT